MQFEIYGKDILITEHLRGHIGRRLCFALGRFIRRIGRVRVSVGDLNGPRGGVDKLCRVSIKLTGSTTILTEDCDSDIYVAIDRAADKAGRCIARRLRRLKDSGQHKGVSDFSGTGV